MNGKSGCRLRIAGVERVPEWAPGNRLDIPLPDHVGPYVAVGDMVTPGAVDCLSDKLVDIGNTVAIVDSIAPEPVSAQRAEWRGSAPVDSEGVDHILFAREVAAEMLLARIAPDWDVARIGVG